MATARKLSARKTRSRKVSRPKQSPNQPGGRPTRRQFQVEITGAKPLIIDLVENELVDIRVHNRPTKFHKPSEPATIFHVSGHRWSDPDFFTLDWGQRTLTVGDTVLIRILEGALKPTAPKEEEKYIEPQKECSFCRRKASEVKELLEANLFTRICNDCVVACYKKLYGKHAT